MKKPFRKVVESKLCEGVVSIGGGFRGRWWELTLECGHDTDRPCRYQPGGERGWGRLWHGRPLSEVLDPPKKVRCYECSRIPTPAQRDLLYRLLEDVAQSIEALERITQPPGGAPT